MKICPSCLLSNEERVPACVWCNTVLANVRSTPSADPNHPEFLREKLARERAGIKRGQIGFAAVSYVLGTTLLAVYPGLIFSPPILLLYAGASVVVVLAIVRDWVGQFTATFLQGAFSLALVLRYGPVQILVVFMLLAQAMLPMVFWHWTEMIHDVNR